jgi:hypothetical protein
MRLRRRTLPLSLSLHLHLPTLQHPPRHPLQLRLPPMPAHPLLPQTGVKVPAATTEATKIEIKPFADTAEPTDAPKESKNSVADGRPKDFKAGVAESLWIWQDAKGTRWHVRGSTKENLHRFSGFVTGEADLKGVKATKTEWADRVMHKGKRAAFDFYVKGASDGMDFDVTGNGCVRFYLMIDGKPADADKINLGKDAVHPEKAHFKLCN